jgi:hypothetical protein
MVVRILRRRRLPLRRFYRRKYFRRVHRPIGSGFSGKRFFNLKCTVAITNNISGNFTVTTDDNPVNAADWNNITALYDFYRVCTIKIRYVPNVSADTTFQYTPGYIFHYANTPNYISPISAAVAAAYEIVDMQRPWKYYRKM